VNSINHFDSIIKKLLSLIFIELEEVELFIGILEVGGEEGLCLGDNVKFNVGWDKFIAMFDCNDHIVDKERD